MQNNLILWNLILVLIIKKWQNVQKIKINFMLINVNQEIIRILVNKLKIKKISKDVKIANTSDKAKKFASRISFINNHIHSKSVTSYEFKKYNVLLVSQYLQDLWSLKYQNFKGLFI